MDDTLLPCGSVRLCHMAASPHATSSTFHYSCNFFCYHFGPIQYEFWFDWWLWVYVVLYWCNMIMGGLIVDFCNTITWFLLYCDLVGPICCGCLWYSYYYCMFISFIVVGQLIAWFPIGLVLFWLLNSTLHYPVMIFLLSTPHQLYLVLDLFLSFIIWYGNPILLRMRMK